MVLINPGPIATDMTKVSHQDLTSNLVHELSQLNAHCVLCSMKYTWQDVFQGVPGQPGIITWPLIKLTPKGVDFSFLFFQGVSDLHWHGNIWSAHILHLLSGP